MQGVNISCLRCGASLPITARFCSRCGAATVQHFVGSTTPSPQSFVYGEPAANPIERTRTLIGTVLLSLLAAAWWTFLAKIILVGLGGMSEDVIPLIFLFLWSVLYGSVVQECGAKSFNPTGLWMEHVRPLSADSKACASACTRYGLPIPRLPCRFAPPAR
jgi:hypothetical protein